MLGLVSPFCSRVSVPIGADTDFQVAAAVLAAAFSFSVVVGELRSSLSSDDSEKLGKGTSDVPDPHHQRRRHSQGCIEVQLYTLPRFSFPRASRRMPGQRRASSRREG